MNALLSVLLLTAYTLPAHAQHSHDKSPHDMSQMPGMFGTSAGRDTAIYPPDRPTDPTRPGTVVYHLYIVHPL
jgi:hypothetical protein